MFTLVSYNVLAAAYVRPEWYPCSPPHFLLPEQRLLSLAEKLVELNADILCLQEVEQNSFGVFEQRLAPLGYVGEFAMKANGRPDGCAIFLRRAEVKCARMVRQVFADAHLTRARHPSGHIAQIAVLRVAGRMLGVANIHLKWDPPDKRREEQFGLFQANQILEHGMTLAPECEGWIICGDFNAAKDSDPLRAFELAGFKPSHSAERHGATCNANRRARMIDFVLHDAALRVTPQPLAGVDDETALPGPGQPSDHVPVGVAIEWVAGVS